MSDLKLGFEKRLSDFKKLLDNIYTLCKRNPDGIEGLETSYLQEFETRIDFMCDDLGEELLFGENGEFDPRESA